MFKISIKQIDPPQEEEILVQCHEINEEVLSVLEKLKSDEAMILASRDGEVAVHDDLAGADHCVKVGALPLTAQLEPVAERRLVRSRELPRPELPNPLRAHLRTSMLSGNPEVPVRE